MTNFLFIHKLTHLNSDTKASEANFIYTENPLEELIEIGLNKVSSSPNPSKTKCNFIFHKLIIIHPKHVTG